MIRSLLFVPGNSPSLLMNADVLGSDAVIFDLEDAVSITEKDSARILVRNLLQSFDYNIKTVVRINCLDTELWKSDLDEIISSKIDFIMLPKTNTASDIKTVSSYISNLENKYHLENNSIKLIALIETALGIENAFSIATSDVRVKALLLGAEDLSADLRCKRTKEGREILYSRERLVIAARAANIDVFDTPFTDVNDDQGIALDSKLAASLGFSGKAVISPRHIYAVNEAFSPSIEDIKYAHEVMDAINKASLEGKGVVSLRGKMIDAPIVTRAKQVIEMEKLINGV